jgi:integrase/recombinase XerD
MLVVHVENAKKNKIIYLFESIWKKQYTDRGIRKILMNYTKEAGIEHSVSLKSYTLGISFVF